MTENWLRLGDKLHRSGGLDGGRDQLESRPLLVPFRPVGSGEGVWVVVC